MFREKTRPVSDFLPRILAHIDGIDTDMVQTYVMDSVIQFLRDTKLMTEVICFDLSGCENSYKLHTIHRVTEILSVRFFIDNRHYPNHNFNFRIENNTLYLDNPPQFARSAKVEVEVAVAPLRDSEQVPDIIYEEWVDAITSLTLSKLYLLTDNEWYNPQGANNQVQLYQQLVRQARFSRVTKHKPFNMRLLNRRKH